MTGIATNPDKVNLGDTRPAWMSDPSLTEVDREIIAAFEGRAGGDGQFANNTYAPGATIPLSIDSDGGSDGVVPDATLPPPTGNPVPAPVTPPPTTDPTTEPDPIPDGIFRVPLPDGQHLDISQEDALNLVRQDQWMRSQPQHVLDAWGKIVRGEGRVFTQQELTQIQRQQISAPTPPTPPTPVAPVVPDLSTLSPEQRAYVERLQSAIPSSPVQPVVQQPMVDPYAEAARQQQIQVQIATEAARQAQQNLQMEGELNTVRGQFGTQYSLSSDQLSRLDAVTQRLGVIPAITTRKRVYSPTGDVIAEPSFTEVLSEAYEYAMSSDTQLRGIRDEYVYNQRLAAQQQQDQATNTKKGRAGSLASAPSAAVSSGQIDPSKMTPQQITAAIAAELSRNIAEGTAEN